VGEVKIFGYILIAVLALSAIVMPLVEMFFAYRERMMLSDALYNSCRVASEASYDYISMRNINAVLNDDYGGFCDTFGAAFAASFGLNYSSRTGNTLRFQPHGHDTYNEFVVELNFKQQEITDYEGKKKMTTEVTAEATSPYKFKHGYLLRLLNSGDISNGYSLNSVGHYTLVITN
jgi:hypothetical protein